MSNLRHILTAYLFKLSEKLCWFFKYLPLSDVAIATMTITLKTILLLPRPSIFVGVQNKTRLRVIV